MFKFTKTLLILNFDSPPSEQLDLIDVALENTCSKIDIEYHKGNQSEIPNFSFFHKHLALIYNHVINIFLKKNSFFNKRCLEEKKITIFSSVQCTFLFYTISQI